MLELVQTLLFLLVLYVVAKDIVTHVLEEVEAEPELFLWDAVPNRAHGERIQVQGSEQFSVMRQREDKQCLQYELQSSYFRARCTCPDCFPKGYFNHPYSCWIKHEQGDLVVERQVRPKIDLDITSGSYEEYSLAQAVISYFSRDESDMDDAQLEAIRRYRELAQSARFKESLDLEDPRSKLSVETMSTLFGIINDIFFFGALDSVHFKWSTKFPGKPSGPSSCTSILACTSMKWDNGRPYPEIKMHPTSMSRPMRHLTRNKITRAQERMGSVLHEMIHAFLMQYACGHCVVKHSEGGADYHGRGFQLIAKAAEEKAPGLLGMEVIVGRLDGIFADMEPSGKLRGPMVPRGPSVHDMEVYGFLDPLTPVER